MNEIPKKYKDAGWKPYSGFTVEAFSRHGKDRQFVSKHTTKRKSGWELVGYGTDGKLKYKHYFFFLEDAFKAGVEME